MRYGLLCCHGEKVPAQMLQHHHLIKIAVVVVVVVVVITPLRAAGLVDQQGKKSRVCATEPLPWVPEPIASGTQGTEPLFLFKGSMKSRNQI